MTGDRKIRTPRERATDLLDVELRKLVRATKRLRQLEAGLEPAKADATSLRDRVLFLAGDPLIAEEDRARILEEVEALEPDVVEAEIVEGDEEPGALFPDDPNVDLTKVDDE